MYVLISRHVSVVANLTSAFQNCEENTSLSYSIISGNAWTHFIVFSEMPKKRIFKTLILLVTCRDSSKSLGKYNQLECLRYSIDSLDVSSAVGCAWAADQLILGFSHETLYFLNLSCQSSGGESKSPVHVKHWRRLLCTLPFVSPTRMINRILKLKIYKLASKVSPRQHMIKYTMFRYIYFASGFSLIFETNRKRLHLKLHLLNTNIC